MPQEYFYHISQKFIIKGKLVEIKDIIMSEGKDYQYRILVDNEKPYTIMADYFAKQKKEYAY